MNYRKEEGRFETTDAKYELFLPSSSSSDHKVGCVVILHGFQLSLKNHRGTAALLAGKGMACLIFDMLPLLTVSKRKLHEKRQANVCAVVEYLNWLFMRSDIDHNSIVLAGHSAGGGIALESVVSLLPTKAIRGLLLLDAVPTDESFQVGSEAKSWQSQHIDDLDHQDACIVVSLRGEPRMFNAYGVVFDQLTRGLVGSTAATDIKVLNARHGDFNASLEGDPTVAFGGFLGIFFWFIGVVSRNKRYREYIQELIVCFCQSTIERDKVYFSQKVKELEQKGIVSVRKFDRSLPSMVS